MKATIIRILAAGLWSSLTAAWAQSAELHFSTDTFHALTLQGQAQVTCQEAGRRETSFVTCTDETLSPGEFDYLYSDEALDASNIVLRNKVGKTNVTQKRGYSAKYKRSATRFNLWVWTLTQNGLLNYGKNNISYELTKGGKSIGVGSFEVNVVDDGARICPTLALYSNNLMDCRSPGGSVCDEYFRLADYCQ